MRNMLRGLAVGLVALAIVGGTIPASAVPPKKTTHVNEGWFTLVFTDETTKAPFSGCEGFSEVMNSERVTEFTYYNKAGAAVKGVLHANFYGTITNADGKTFRDHSVFTERYDLVNGTTTVSGPSYHYIVKGKGQVFAEVGHKITIDATGEIVFQSGQSDFVEQDMEGICAALS
jgi:hypothetical protein